jgi:acyl carrier protein
MEEKILEILRQVLDIEDLDATCSQTTCEAWDSLHHLNLVVEMEDAFDVTFEPEEIAVMKSVEDIKNLLAAKKLS